MRYVSSHSYYIIRKAKSAQRWKIHMLRISPRSQSKWQFWFVFHFSLASSEASSISDGRKWIIDVNSSFAGLLLRLLAINDTVNFTTPLSASIYSSSSFVFLLCTFLCLLRLFALFRHFNCYSTARSCSFLSVSLFMCWSFFLRVSLLVCVCVCVCVCVYMYLRVYVLACARHTHTCMDIHLKIKF